MTRRNPPAKWTLPNVIDPSTSVCYTVPVPNEKYHIAAFLGALQDLGSWYRWAEDAAHTAKDVAKVWRDIIDELEKELCSGCKHTNPAFLPPLEAGETKTLSITVEAGEFQILPILLLPNQSITISNMVGQWRDSTYHPSGDCVSNWETPLGVVIDAFGAIPADIFETDVMPEISHMKLIMRVNACDVLSYHDLDDPITFTVPGSAPSAGVFVEFLGNCPVDGTNEIAAGFLGYGMVCFKAIVSDPNLCPQVFIDFESGSLGEFTLLEGTIVSTSPIGEGSALRSDSVGLTTAEAKILIPVDDCTIRDFAFTWNMHQVGTVQSFSIAWVIKDGGGATIATGSENIAWVQDETGSMTVDVETPEAASLTLTWVANLSPQFDSSEFWIDNVFVN